MVSPGPLNFLKARTLELTFPLDLLVRSRGATANRGAV